MSRVGPGTRSARPAAVLGALLGAVLGWIAAGCEPGRVDGAAPEVDAEVWLAGAEHLQLGEEVRCASEPAVGTGPYQREVVGGDWPLVDPGEGDFPRDGQGVVVADLDGDGWLDLFVPRMQHPSHVLLGRGSRFVPADERLTAEVSGALGASGADADGDGDIDLVVYRYDQEPLILWNDAGWLRPEVLPVPAEGPVGCGLSSSWADFDLDGDLDLLLGRADREGHRVSCPSWLLANDGAGRFTPVEGALSADVQADRVMVGAWLPLDDDPWPELYVVTDFPDVLPGNRVLDNDQGSLTQLDGHPLEVKLAGMGVAVADLDDDLRPDVFVPGIDEYVLFVSASGGIWIDHSQAWGLVPDGTQGQHTAWSGALEDLDGDGLEDLVVSFGPGGDEGGVATLEQPDEVYRQVGWGRWDRVASAWGLADTASTRSVVTADLDRNGFLDLVRPGMGGATVVDRARCNDNAWLVVALHQPGGNPHAVGAQVRVWDDGEQWWRLVSAGSTGFASSGPPEVHFGLGDRDQVDGVEVVWPDGEVLRVGPVPTRRRVQLRREP